MFHADRRIDRQKLRKLIFAYCNFVTAPKSNLVKCSCHVTVYAICDLVLNV